MPHDRAHDLRVAEEELAADPDEAELVKDVVQTAAAADVVAEQIVVGAEEVADALAGTERNKHLSLATLF